MSGDTSAVRERWRVLRATAGPVGPSELDALWAHFEVIDASPVLHFDGSHGPDTTAGRGEAPSSTRQSPTSSPEWR
ncbi:hypothetical protein [Streptomyces sp. NPDC055134]